MAIKITSIQREKGSACNHIKVTVDDEGVARNFVTSEDELTDYFEKLEGNYKKALVLAWIRHRRLNGRSIINIDIA